MAKDIVDVALGQIGYREQGNNRTKYGEWFGMNGAAWCSCFLTCLSSSPDFFGDEQQYGSVS